jgi:hypothetical protein
LVLALLVERASAVQQRLSSEAQKSQFLSRAVSILFEVLAERAPPQNRNIRVGYPRGYPSNCLSLDCFTIKDMMR